MFSPSPGPANPLMGVFIVASALVALNGSTGTCEIAADAWEREQGSCLLKEGADVKQLQERAT